MPPFRRYWLLYLLLFFGAAAIFLAVRHLLAEQAKPGDTAPLTAWMILAGVSATLLGIIAGAWMQWRSAAVANALSALQTLRTDRKYLINIYVVRKHLRGLGAPLGPEALAAFHDATPSESVDAPTFRDASLFVLNQYEFIAAGVRSGAIDYRLVETTSRGPIVKLISGYRRPLNEMRAANPRSLENLLWLYRRFRASPPYDRGRV